MAYKKTKQTRAQKTRAQTDQILNKLIAKVNDENCMPWQKTWQGVNKDCRPFNFDSGKAYNGGNVFLLGLASMGDVPAFAPANDKHKPFKGTKAWYILKPRNYKVEDKKTGEEKFVFGGCTLIPVFHFRDLQNVDVEAIEKKYAPKTAEVASEFNPIAECESVVAGMPKAPKMANNGGDRAFYRPSTDSISMPLPETFISSEAYYQTLFHEMAHSTGHTNRLNRFKSNDDNYHADSYGFEELVAELTACFIGSQTGSFSEKECNNSASYLKNWIGKLRDNPEWILKASTLAGKATEAILDTKPVYTESEA